jgi:starch synthase
MTREYPPEVYGGAGVHVDYLSRHLARLARVTVRCFGPPREVSVPAQVETGTGLAVEAFRAWPELARDDRYAAALQVISVDLAMASGLQGSDVVHSHTWYANLGGHLARLIYGVPHVVTTHSLEPLRPWKAEQLGPGGYAVSTFCERTALEGADAVIAVSRAMRDDTLRVYPAVDPERVVVIHNGVDTEEYRPDPGTDVLKPYGVTPDRPIVLFVGRIARQKGIVHLLEAARLLDPRAQLVLCAATPDTEEILRETRSRIEELRTLGRAVIWIDRMLPRRDVVQLLSHATVFCCPSIYEPLGIVNLEAMACEAAVVATATGGIPEVVEDGRTGLLVPIDPRDDGTGEPKDGERFARDLAEAINELVGSPEQARALGRAGRQRVIERFSWPAVAERTIDLYRRVIGGSRKS